MSTTISMNKSNLNLLAKRLGSSYENVIGAVFDDIEYNNSKHIKNFGEEHIGLSFEELRRDGIKKITGDAIQSLIDTIKKKVLKKIQEMAGDVSLNLKLGQDKVPVVESIVRGITKLVTGSDSISEDISLVWRTLVDDLSAITSFISTIFSFFSSLTQIVMSVIARIADAIINTASSLHSLMVRLKDKIKNLLLAIKEFLVSLFVTSNASQFANSSFVIINTLPDAFNMHQIYHKSYPRKDRLASSAAVRKIAYSTSLKTLLEFHTIGRDNLRIIDVAGWHTIVALSVLSGMKQLFDVCHKYFKPHAYRADEWITSFKSISKHADDFQAASLLCTSVIEMISENPQRSIGLLTTYNDTLLKIYHAVFKSDVLKFDLQETIQNFQYINDTAFRNFFYTANGELSPVSRKHLPIPSFEGMSLYLLSASQLIENASKVLSSSTDDITSDDITALSRDTLLTLGFSLDIFPSPTIGLGIKKESGAQDEKLIVEDFYLVPYIKFNGMREISEWYRKQMPIDKTEVPEKVVKKERIYVGRDYIGERKSEREMDTSIATHNPTATLSEAIKYADRIHERQAFDASYREDVFRSADASQSEDVAPYWIPKDEVDLKMLQARALAIHVRNMNDATRGEYDAQDRSSRNHLRNLVNGKVMAWGMDTTIMEQERTLAAFMFSTGAYTACTNVNSLVGMFHSAGAYMNDLLHNVTSVAPPTNKTDADLAFSNTTDLVVNNTNVTQEEMVAVSNETQSLSSDYNVETPPPNQMAESVIIEPSPAISNQTSTEIIPTPAEALVSVPHYTHFNPRDLELIESGKQFTTDELKLRIDDKENPSQFTEYLFESMKRSGRTQTLNKGYGLLSPTPLSDAEMREAFKKDIENNPDYVSTMHDKFLDRVKDPDNILIVPNAQTQQSQVVIPAFPVTLEQFKADYAIDRGLNETAFYTIQALQYDSGIAPSQSNIGFYAFRTVNEKGIKPVSTQSQLDYIKNNYPLRDRSKYLDLLNKQLEGFKEKDTFVTQHQGFLAYLQYLVDTAKAGVDSVMMSPSAYRDKMEEKIRKESPEPILEQERPRQVIGETNDPQLLKGLKVVTQETVVKEATREIVNTGENVMTATGIFTGTLTGVGGQLYNKITGQDTTTSTATSSSDVKSTGVFPTVTEGSAGNSTKIGVTKEDIQNLASIDFWTMYILAPSQYRIKFNQIKAFMESLDIFKKTFAGVSAGFAAAGLGKKILDEMSKYIGDLPDPDISLLTKYTNLTSFFDGYFAAYVLLGFGMFTLYWLYRRTVKAPSYPKHLRFSQINTKLSYIKNIYRLYGNLSIIRSSVNTFLYLLIDYYDYLIMRESLKAVNYQTVDQYMATYAGWAATVFYMGTTILKFHLAGSTFLENSLIKTFAQQNYPALVNLFNVKTPLSKDSSYVTQGFKLLSYVTNLPFLLSGYVTDYLFNRGSGENNIALKNMLATILFFAKDEGYNAVMALFVTKYQTDFGIMPLPEYKFIKNVFVETYNAYRAFATEFLSGNYDFGFTNFNRRSDVDKKIEYLDILNIGTDPQSFKDQAEFESKDTIPKFNTKKIIIPFESDALKNALGLIHFSR